jgi:hypothetical protein
MKGGVISSFSPKDVSELLYYLYVSKINIISLLLLIDINIMKNST